MCDTLFKFIFAMAVFNGFLVFLSVWIGLFFEWGSPDMVKIITTTTLKVTLFMLPFTLVGSVCLALGS